MKAGPAPQITLRWLLTRWKRQRGYCPIFRVKMAMKGPLGATIDQIEPGKGYTRRNTQLVTHCGNGFKGGVTMRETRQLRRQILGVLAAAAARRNRPGRNAVHNGSLMTMFANPDTGDLVINYALPRPDLLGLVGPGTTLVRGRWSGDVFVGEARVFSRYCGAVPYPVRGSVDQSNALMLFGPAPQFDTACNVIGFDINSRNAVLRFEPEGPQ
jgi:hypothetical protein